MFYRGPPMDNKSIMQLKSLKWLIAIKDYKINMWCKQSVPIPHSAIWSYLNIFRHINTYSIWAYVGISIYDIQRFDLLSRALCKIWMNSISRLSYLRSYMIYYWLCHFSLRRSSFLNTVPFDHTIGFCSSFISNVNNH